MTLKQIILCGFSMALLGGCASTAADYQRQATYPNDKNPMRLTPINDWKIGGAGNGNGQTSMTADPAPNGNGYRLFILKNKDNQLHRKNVNLNLLKTYKVELTAIATADCEIQSYLNPDGRTSGRSWDPVTNEKTLSLQANIPKRFEGDDALCYKVTNMPEDNLWFTFNLRKCLPQTWITLKDMTMNEVEESECRINAGVPRW